MNVIAELPGANDDNVVMAGAHLDSRAGRPGDQRQRQRLGRAARDGAAARRNLKPQNTLRFAWWGAEEVGPDRLDRLRQRSAAGAELDRIALYMNFDMVGSPNYIFMRLRRRPVDASRRSGAPMPDRARPRSRTCSSRSTRSRASPTTTPRSAARSDYQAFIANGIPSSGLFTGAEVPKTAEQQSIWGGTVGAQFDPCYHLACDTFANNNNHALGVNAKSIAFAALTYAYSTESVNGVPGAAVPGKFTIPPPAGSEGTFVP